MLLSALTFFISLIPADHIFKGLASSHRMSAGPRHKMRVRLPVSAVRRHPHTGMLVGREGKTAEV